MKSQENPIQSGFPDHSRPAPVWPMQPPPHGDPSRRDRASSQPPQKRRRQQRGGPSDLSHDAGPLGHTVVALNGSL